MLPEKASYVQGSGTHASIPRNKLNHVTGSRNRSLKRSMEERCRRRFSFRPIMITLGRIEIDVSTLERRVSISTDRSSGVPYMPTNITIHVYRCVCCNTLFTSCDRMPRQCKRDFALSIISSTFVFLLMAILILQLCVIFQKVKLDYNETSFSNVQY